MAIMTFPKGASSEIVKDKFELTLSCITLWVPLKKVVDNDNSLIEYEDIGEWTRRGAETYTAVFRIRFFRKAIEIEKLINLKAIFAFNSIRRLQDWKIRGES